MIIRAGEWIIYFVYDNTNASNICAHWIVNDITFLNTFLWGGYIFSFQYFANSYQAIT